MACAHDEEQPAGSGGGRDGFFSSVEGWGLGPTITYPPHWLVGCRSLRPSTRSVAPEQGGAGRNLIHPRVSCTGLTEWLSSKLMCGPCPGILWQYVCRIQCGIQRTHASPEEPSNVISGSAVLRTRCEFSAYFLLFYVILLD